MATGDLCNNIKQLIHELKAVKYGKILDVDLAVSGSPTAFLPIYNYLFTSYSTKLNADIVNSNNELYGKSDMRFMEAVYKILRDMFDYKAKITRDQFFAPGFSEHKVIMATEVLRAVKNRYSLRKSSKFHVAAPKSSTGSRAAATPAPEQVVQEPVEMPRKISNKLKAPNVAGAIVLPTRPAGLAGYKIPRATTGHLGLKHNQERPVFAEMVPVASSDSASGVSQRSKRDIEPRVVRAWEEPGAENFHPSVPVPTQNGGLPVDFAGGASALPDSDELEVLVRRKVVDLVSPALVRMNERISMLDITCSELEKKREEPVKSEPPPSAALITGLTKQMNDVVFKLQTLTSRVTLMENRVTMLEAQLSDEVNHRMTLFASQSFLQSKANPDKEGRKPLHNSPQHFAASSLEKSGSKPQGRSSVPGPGEAHAQGSSDGAAAGERASLVIGDGDRITAGPVAQVETAASDREDRTGTASNPPSLAFMKTLVNPEDCGSLLTTSETEAPEDLTVTEEDNATATTAVVAATNAGSDELLSQQQHDKSEEQQQNERDQGEGKPKQQVLPASAGAAVLQQLSAAASRRTPFSEDFSPIRHFSDFSFTCGNQDESASLIFSGVGLESFTPDQSRAAGHRSSTPTSKGLDTSTLDRISRINQMMAATEQLLQ